MEFAKAAAYARRSVVAALATMACVAFACSNDASSNDVTCKYAGHEYLQGSFPCPGDSLCSSCFCQEDGGVSISTYTSCNNGGSGDVRDAETDANVDASDASDASADADAAVSDADSDADGGTDSD